VKTLFDTSVLIEHLRGEERATRLLQSVATSDRLASVLTRIELEGGIRSGERQQVASLLGALTLLPVTDTVARRAAEHLRRFRGSHPGIDLIDYAIGATAELNDAALATLNIRHFPMFKDIRAPW